MKTDHKTRLGEKHKRLTLISIEGSWARSTWGRFKCDCGTEKVIRLYAVFNGKTGSCGCHKSAITADRNATHGLSNLPEYNVYCCMKARCLNPNNPAYDKYGGRGIVVCTRWLESFQHFIDDMGPRPTIKHSLDRIDNDGPYSPDNCRWATDSEQCSNRRSTVYLTYKGRKQCVKHWVKELGVPRGWIQSKIDLGIPVEEIIESYL